jgi:hypothetical protein
MSSSPSRQEPRAPVAGNPSSGKRRAPPEGTVHSHQKENTEPRSQNDMIPDNSDTWPQSHKSSSLRTKIASAEGFISEQRGPLANRQARPQQNIVKPQYDDGTMPDDRNPRSQPRNSSPQTSRPAPAGKSSAQKRRPPTGQTAQPRQHGDSNIKNPRMYPDHIPDSSDFNYVPERYGNDDDYVSKPYYDELDGNPTSQPRQKNPSRAGAALAMKARVRGNQQDLNPNGPRTDRCDGSCEWSRKAKAELHRKDKELTDTKRLLEDARDEIKKLRMSADLKKLSMQTKSVAADQKRLDKKDAAQTRSSALERKRKEKMDADRRKREEQLEAKREQREHERKMDEMKTPEERAAERDAKHQKVMMAGNLASTAGSLLVEAHKANSQVQTARMHQEMQGQTAARRQAQKEGATSSGQTPATTRRPNGNAARPRRPQGPEQELEGMQSVARRSDVI